MPVSPLNFGAEFSVHSLKISLINCLYNIRVLRKSLKVYHENCSVSFEKRNLEN